MRIGIQVVPANKSGIPQGVSMTRPLHILRDPAGQVKIERGVGKFQRIWMNLGVTLACIGLAGFVWTFSLWDHQSHTLPRAPDLAVGRVYPRNIHGVVVYQTLGERNYLETVQKVSAGVFVISFLMSVIYKRKWGDEVKVKPLNSGMDHRLK